MKVNEKLVQLISLLLNGNYYPICNYSDEEGQLIIDLEDSHGNCIGGLVLNNLNKEELQPFLYEALDILWSC